MDDRERLLVAAKALDPARPTVARQQGLDVEPPDGGARGRIALWCRRNPAAHVLFLGGIGAGKTTELLAARDVIHREGLARAHHVELDAYFDMSHPREGLLVTLTGLAILDALRPEGSYLDAELQQPARFLHTVARSRRKQPPELFRPELLAGGPIAPAQPAATIAERIQPLADRWSTRDKGSPPIMLLVDAMDRRPFDDFVTMTREDLPILRRFGVGIALAGSLEWRHRIDRETAVRFEDWWVQAAYDPARREDSAFLHAVLDRRAAAVLSTPVAERLVQASGGVLRDLLMLARGAVYEAVDSLESAVTYDSAARAIDAFREGCLAALTPHQRAALERLEQDAVQPDMSTGEALQARGCTIWRDDRQWTVHPAVRAREVRHEAA